jgi:ribosomal protein S18 acetylase RimI-like enzyme
MTISVRPFVDTDADDLVEILKLNHQYDYPDVEGPDSMKRVGRCEAAIFLVAVVDGETAGLIKAVYDGSRALIHLLSVHPDQQGKSVGTRLVDEVKKELTARGATGMTVTVSDRSAGFWEKIGFERLPVVLMLNEFK